MNTTENPPPGDQGLAFQTHALQMILFGPFYVRTQYCFGSSQNRVLTIIYINYMIYISIFLSGLLIIYYIVFLMLYNLFIILITILYIYTQEKKSLIRRWCKEKKKNLGILNLCTYFCIHFLLIIHVVEPWRY